MYSDSNYRFCSKEYYPFDAEIVNKYVVTDDYKPVWEVGYFYHIMSSYYREESAMAERIALGFWDRASPV